MSIRESIRRHPISYATSTVLAVGLGIMELVGYASNPTYDVPDKTCVSPMAASFSYHGSWYDIPLFNHAGLFASGIEAKGQIPAGADGIRVGFRAPDGLPGWHTSDMLKGDASGRYVVKMAIGVDPVEFGVQVVAPEGSDLCKQAPAVEYTWLTSNDQYQDDPGQLPWPNPINVITNELP